MLAVMIFALALTAALAAACGSSSTSPPASSSPAATVAAASPTSTPTLPPDAGTGERDPALRIATYDESLTDADFKPDTLSGRACGLCAWRPSPTGAAWRLEALEAE